MYKFSMTALRAHRQGGPEVLQLEDIDLPEPRAGEVLVEVHAAGITFAELGWNETWNRDGRSRLPVTPAHEVSGIVAKLGSEVDSFRRGDKVFGLVPFDQDGAAASYVRLPAENLALKPAGLAHVTAAALPIGAQTAWQALVQHGKVTRGERVLIHGGAGAVGSLAVQIATARGADVTATARDADIDFVRSLGAREIVSLEKFDQVPQLYDVVLDTFGGEVTRRSMTVLRAGGRIVCLSAPPPPTDRDDITASFFVVEAQRSVLDELASLVVRGELVVPIAATYPLERGREAYESGGSLPRTPGKTVITVHGEPASGSAR